MIIPGSKWLPYIDMLAEISGAAAALFADYLKSHDATMPGERQAAIDYAHALAKKYGESAAALSCEMYDAIAGASGVHVPPAEPAPTATYQEVAKAINGAYKNKRSTPPQTVARLVKQAGADTTLKNAARDGAEFAWIPHGDTCAFCLVLGSRGWQRISKKSLKNGHAEHIHANCDCEYCVRFDKKTTVAGYDPDKLKAQYDAADGNTPQEKINSIRREQYMAKEAEKKTLVPKDITEEYFATATPGSGVLEWEPHFNPKDHDAEIKMAQWLHDVFGGDLTILAESKVEGEETPDYRWRGKLWDLKSFTSSTYNKTDKRIQKGSSQIDKKRGGIILDYTGSSLSLSEAEEYVRRSAAHRIHKPTDIIIKKGDEVKALRYAN